MWRTSCALIMHLKRQPPLDQIGDTQHQNWSLPVITPPMITYWSQIISTHWSAAITKSVILSRTNEKIPVKELLKQQQERHQGFSSAWSTPAMYFSPLPEDWASCDLLGLGRCPQDPSTARERTLKMAFISFNFNLCQKKNLSWHNIKVFN